MSWISKLFKKSERTPAIVPSSETSFSERPDEAYTASTVIGADNPIRLSVDDRLDRAHAAESFASNVLRLDSSEGIVVGVLGPWGSGKTSFVNLSRPSFEREEIPILDFNPWMFSGAEQLVQSFFSEISAQLKLKPGLVEVGKGFEEYGELFSGLAWIPVVGPWIERGQDVAKLIGALLQRKKEGIGSQRKKVELALRRLKKPIVVILDDIDRLNTGEIRDIFRLVRLTANFPNVIYALAFDRKRVEEALSEEGIPGRAYLEKILQLGFDLPSVPDHVLNQQVFDGINSALDGIPNTGKFDTEMWPDIFMEVVRPLICNMRDVRRYAAAIGGTVRDIDGQIALVDVLALEAIRVFLPDVFQRFPASVAGLTTVSDISYGGHRDQVHLKQQVDQLIQVAGEKGDVVNALIQRLFMAGQRHIGGSHYGPDWSKRWLRERRVAHVDVFRFYLERIAGQGLLAFSVAEQAWARMGEAEPFEAYLRAVKPELVLDIIASLETYEDEITPDRVIPGATVLLSLLPSLPEQESGMFSFGTQMVVGRVVYRLVRSLPSPEAVEAAVRAILPKLAGFYSKLSLIEMVGWKESVGHKLVSAEFACELETSWRAQVRSTDAYDLAREKDLLRSLLVAKREAAPGEPTVAVPQNTQVTLSLLRSARSEVRSQTMGNRAVSRLPQLAWDALTELYGDEEVLQTRISELKASQPADCDELLTLADKYVSGWRPKDFGKD